MTDAADQSPAPDVDELVEELRSRVEQRRRDGLYPDDLVDRLDDHFRRIVGERSVVDFAAVQRRLDALDAVAAFDPARVSTASGVPGGRTLHATVARVVARQMQGVYEQMQAFADAVRDTLHEMAEAMAQPHTHVHADMLGQVDALFEQVAAFERGPVDSATAVASLRARVEALEAARAGSDTDEVGRLRTLAAHVDGGPVLDIGPGPDAFTEALRSRGVDVQAIAAAAALDAVADAADGSVAAIAVVDTIDRLSPEGAVALVELAATKLRPGGRLVVSTPAAQRLYVFAYLQVVLDRVGFTDVALEPGYALVATR